MPWQECICLQLWRLKIKWGITWNAVKGGRWKASSGSVLKTLSPVYTWKEWALRVSLQGHSSAGPCLWLHFPFLTSCQAPSPNTFKVTASMLKLWEDTNIDSIPKNYVTINFLGYVLAFTDIINSNILTILTKIFFWKMIINLIFFFNFSDPSYIFHVY